jgi:hypothetical protein
MKQSDRKRLDKIIQRERNRILETQDGLDPLTMDKSVDKAVINNLSKKLSRQDLNRVASLLSHYYNHEKGHFGHLHRKGIKVGLAKQWKKLRFKQKKQSKVNKE